MEIKMYKKNGFSVEEELAKYLLEDPKRADEKISALVNGVDKESKETIYRIVSRIQYALLNGNKPVQKTKKEKEICNIIESEFEPNICMITPQKYYYNGYYLPVRQFEVGVFLHKHSMDVFSTKTLEMIKNKDIIDLGAFVGDSAIVLREFTKQKIHAFEPMSKNYKLMEQTLKMNESSQIIPQKKALGDKKGQMEFSSCGMSSGMLYNFGGKSEMVEIDTLDDYVEKNNIKVGFIKVDIEGSEDLFLRGGVRTIKEQKPAMLISIYHNVEQFFGIKPFLESLNLGYKFKIHKAVDYTIGCDTALYCEAL